MENYYHIDTKSFPVDRLQRILRAKELLPGRVVLRVEIEERFALIRQQGINTLHDLLEALKTKTKIEQFARRTGLAAEYLTILRREANSYLPAPVRLTELPLADTAIIEKLDQAGIKNTEQLLGKAALKHDRENLEKNLSLGPGSLTEAVKLSDLVRITGVGPVFARIILDTGIGSAEDFLSHDPQTLFEKLTLTNQEKALTKVKFSIKDIEYCMELGRFLPVVPGK